ncbi:integral membrane protein [Colletotrichum plurivorum]|uniref:Integral membrane protein n=1 Tax=Colletotrichum plurivorum TaxID=2175906 RepID=A0A8H6NK70_9PEZI|nr:integral membrane protein [Colletotrichum plurivorum]
MSTSTRDAQNSGPTALAAVSVVSVISTLFTVARLYTRGRIMGKIRLDDYLIMASVVCGWVNVATLAVAVSYGYGRHADTLTPEQKSNAMLWSVAGYAPGLLSIGLPKPAVVALLTRILNPSRFHKWFLWSLAGVCVGNIIGYIAIIFAQCQPASAQWNKTVEGVCWDRWVLVSYAIYSSAFCAFADIYLSIYPAVVLSKLQMDIRKKAVLSVALGFGSISSIVVIYKCTRLPKLTSPDSTYDTVELVIWTITEGCIIVIAACVPVLQPLAELVFGRRIFSSRRYSHHNTGSGPDGKSGLSRGFRSRAKKNEKEGFSTDMSSFGSVAKTTLVTKGSQENILEKYESDGKIVRTDAFTITVESDKA